MAKQTGNIVKKAIQIDASNSVRTVKSLKQEISDLRDELLNLDKDTKEYEDTQKQLQQDVEDLNEVMNAHKDKAKALEGSYNDLQSQLKELKTAWKETNDEAERDEIGAQIKSINDKLKEMDASIGDFHRNVGNYESAWNGLNGVMDKSEKITDDLEKGIKAFGTAIGLSDKQVKTLSNGLKKMKDALKIAKDITSTEKATKNLATAEQQAAGAGAAMATSQKAAGTAAKTMAVSEVAATTATKGLSVAMKGLKTALLSTGIGALIVALGSLIGLMDKAIGRLNQAKFEKKYGTLLEDVQGINKAAADRLETMQEEQHQLDLNLRLEEARNTKERDRMVMEKETTEKMLATAKQQASLAEANLKTEQAVVDSMKKKEQESEAVQNSLKETEAVYDAWNDKVKELEGNLQKINDDILVYDEAAKFKVEVKETTKELKSWAELVKDEKFQMAWHHLFEIDFSEAGSPSEVLKVQKEAAKNLIQMYSGDTKEVEQFFDHMIAEAEAEWQSLVEKEKQIFDERLTPAQRLENEKEEWVTLANRWGMDATTIVKYYNDKITEELKKADNERKEADEKAAADRLAAIEEQLDQIDAVLATQEKMNAIFNPLFMSDTASGDIEQEMENLQNLYNTQMEYLNSLLESAELTEEAYGAVEDRILSLTVAFNSQMNVLKKEQEQQGKNFALLARKHVASFSLMEQAAGDYANAFQSLGLESSIAYKGFASAQALISALLAANRVLAEEPGPMVVKGIAAAAALAAGIANLVSIWAVDPSGSNAGSMSSSVGMQATPVIGYSQPIQYSRNITSAEEEDAMNAPIYVQVVDIEDGLNGRKAQISNSSF